jgi:predicted ATP-grasp superfamily ATP-dependent carboligase
MKALLLDTNIASYPIFSELTNLGFSVAVVGNNATDFLAQVADKFFLLDYSDLESLFNLCKGEDFQIVIPGSNDKSYEVCSKVIERLEVTVSIDKWQIVRQLHQKDLFKAVATSLNLFVPRELSVDDLLEKDFKKCIIKPVDAYSGRGVTVIEHFDVEYIHRAILEAKSFSSKGTYIIEEYVDGELYSHSCFIKGGYIYFDVLVKEMCNLHKFSVDESWVVSDEAFPFIEDFRIQIQKLSKELQLCDGLIHTQFIFSDTGFKILEITRRCPGDLYSLLIQKSTGFNYALAYVASFLSLDIVLDDHLFYKKVIRRTVKQDKGQFLSIIPRDNERIIEFYPLKRSGDVITGVQDRIGILFSI